MHTHTYIHMISIVYSPQLLLLCCCWHEIAGPLRLLQLHPQPLVLLPAQDHQQGHQQAHVAYQPNSRRMCLPMPLHYQLPLVAQAAQA
jgi:hypothetical protein